MSIRIPSEMVPGEWEQRRRSGGPAVAVTPPPPATPVPAVVMGLLAPAAIATASAPEWPFWARVSLFVGLLFAAMFIAMWGASQGPS